MAIVERPIEDEGPKELEAPPASRRPSEGVFKRPTNTEGWTSWFTTVDHKRIGIMYGAAALFFFVVGGLEAGLIRLQLARPNQEILNEDLYNQVFTMHGTTMIFFVVIPMGAAFMNYLMPLQVGARDVAFPRLNAFSFWTFLAGGIFFNLAWFTGGGADCGWFCYAPNSGLAFSPGNGVDYYALGLQIAGIASLVGAMNLIVTVINLRAPGMSMMRLPVFTWMALVVQMLLLFAIPVISVALFLLTFDRLFDANFFNVEAGADPLLWQHLFWIFGHPEVYILILPAFGIVSEIIPVFSRKPLFGYPFVVFSGIAIGFMGWGVWAHHMFVSGLGPVSVAAFAATTMFIAVPTGVKILNWVATMWGGKVRFDTPMLFSTALVAMFTIGGLSGVMHSIAPSDTQQTDTYFIVAHFHYVLFGGALMGFFGGLYFWWPKVFGHKLDERRGKWHFWTNFVGFNLTFGPMHVLGLQGMPRRYQTYDANIGFEFWNMAATIGVVILGWSFLIFLWNIWKSYVGWKAEGKPDVGPDPWDARSLEWTVQSPTPHHNFDVTPTVTQVDDFWHRKYAKDETGRYRRIATGAELAQPGTGHPHLPAPSYWPLVVSVGLPFIAAGVMYHLGLAVVGGILVVGGVYGWITEPADAEPDDHDAPEDEEAHVG
ncbi:MAG: cytochrome c oxidase subunit I [Actinomycetota bacterium]